MGIYFLRIHMGLQFPQGMLETSICMFKMKSVLVVDKNSYFFIVQLHQAGYDFSQHGSWLSTV